MKAFSYIRWSSNVQSEGDSLPRQLEATRRICEEKGWELDESLKPDKGVSAYFGNNIENGSLGIFLQAVKAQKIEVPCVLVVEALDRLTRTRLREARRLFEGLLEQGVSICTANNGKVYDQNSLENPLDLLMSLMELNAAYQYSAGIGRRVSAAWTRKKEAAAKGEILTSRTPAWLIANRATNRFKIIKSKATIVRRIFREYLNGKGARLIAYGLDKEDVPNFGWGAGWSATSVRRILMSCSVIGDYQPCKYLSKTKRVPEGAAIQGYYPSVIEKHVFYSAQERMKARFTPRGARKHVFNLFSGLIKCALCGSTIVLKVGGIVKTGNKTPSVGLVCSKAQRGKGCKYHTMRYRPFERGVLTALYGRIQGAIKQPKAPRSKKNELAGLLKHTEARIAQLNDLIQMEKEIPKSVVKTISQLENKAEEIKSQIENSPSEAAQNRAEWQRVPNTLENRLRMQMILSNEIESITLDPIKREAIMFAKEFRMFRKGEKESQAIPIPLKWDEDEKNSFLFFGERQNYLDESLVWLTPNAKQVKITVHALQ